MKQQGVAFVLKRAVDRAVAGAALVALAPVLAATGAAIWATMGRPILFRQERPGIRGKPFQFLKFRTMSTAVGPDGKPLSDEARMHPVGNILRRSSLDELPQLWNVLRGELSLVGPRPLLMRYLPRYTPEQARRHEVMPGITGWAQVSGRNALSWERKFELDIWYADNWSPWLDIRILFATVGTLIRREGISNAGSATMPEFMGNSTKDAA